MLRVPGRQHGLMLRSDAFDLDVSVLPELQRILAIIGALRMKFPHVVGVHQPAGFIESTRRRPGLRLIADMPLAKHRRAVTGRLQHLTQRGKRRIEASCVWSDGAHYLGPPRIASTEKRGS